MLTTESATVYRSSLAGRRFLTKRSAAKAEARKLLEERYPTDEDFYWLNDLPRAHILYRRVTRLILRTTP